MIKGNVLIRASCRDRDTWMKLIRGGELNAIDLCLDIYSESEVHTINNVFGHRNKVLIAYATPIISIAFLLYGRLKTLFKNIQKVKLDLSLNSKALSYIRMFSAIEIDDIRTLEKIVKTLSVLLLGEGIDIDIAIKESKENYMELQGTGTLFDNKPKNMKYAIVVDTSKNNEMLFVEALVEILDLDIDSLKGFKTMTDIGEIEGLYTYYLSRLSEKGVIRIEEVS